MPYILVCSVMKPGTQGLLFGGSTIEGEISQNTGMQLNIKRSSGDYKTDMSPYEVLNVLETEGYKVVGTNTVTKYDYNDVTTSSHSLIWTLHKQA